MEDSNSICRHAGVDAVNQSCPQPLRGHLKHAQKAVAAGKEISYGTCYAHAVASALQSVNLSIFGRVEDLDSESLERDYWHLVDDIVDVYGIDGASAAEVLKQFAPKHTAEYLMLGEAGNPCIDGIAKGLQGNPLPRAVVAAFWLPDVDELWNELFNSGCQNKVMDSVSLQRAREHVHEKCGADALQRKDVGHAVTIVGQTPSAWIVKNSWGHDWGNLSGFFLLSKHDRRLHQDLKLRCYDVFFRINGLRAEDKARYAAASEAERRAHDDRVLEQHRRCLPTIYIPNTSSLFIQCRFPTSFTHVRLTVSNPLEWDAHPSAYHGTSVRAAISIIQQGFRLPSQLGGVRPGSISPNIQVFGIEKWGDACFFHPSHKYCMAYGQEKANPDMWSDLQKLSECLSVPGTSKDGCAFDEFLAHARNSGGDILIFCIFLCKVKRHAFTINPRTGEPYFPDTRGFRSGDGNRVRADSMEGRVTDPRNVQAVGLLMRAMPISEWEGFRTDPTKL